jgi:hypothetical protein
LPGSGHGQPPPRRRLARRARLLPLLLFLFFVPLTAALAQTRIADNTTAKKPVPLSDRLVAPRAGKHDRDHDGLRNRFERHHWQTNPRKSDTDGDGFVDGYEVFVLHTDPLRPNGTGVTPGPRAGGTPLPPKLDDLAPTGPAEEALPEEEAPTLPPEEESPPPEEEPVPPEEEVPAEEEPAPPEEEVPPPAEEEPAPPAEEESPPPAEEEVPPPAEEEPAPPEEEVPPPAVDGEVSTAAQLLAVAKSAASDGKTFYLRGGSYGSVDLGSVRRGALVTFLARPNEVPMFGTLSFASSQNLRFDGFRASTIDIEAGNATNLNRDLQFANCTLGGSEGARINPLAVVGILGYTEDVLIDRCSIGWTNMNGQEDNGNGIRAVNGDQGPIDGLTIERSRIHHVSCDAIQVAGNSRFTLDRTEIAYVAPEPGYTCHADSLQSLGFVGDAARITNNYIHHIGYYDEHRVPSAGDPAGQLIYANNGGGALIENNLFVDSRNYALNLGSGCGGCPSSLRNVVLRRNTIVRDGTAFGGESTPDMRWAPQGGSGNAFDRNVIGGIAADGSLSSSVVAFSGNVFTDQSPIGPGDVGPVKLSFDAEMNCTATACADAGYRKPSGVGW